MEMPFLFGKITDASNFVNRVEDIKNLTNNFLSGMNTVLVSPRRWGKSSLVEHVSQKMSTYKKLVICKIDLYNIRSEEEFYICFANEIIRKTTSKWEESVDIAKQFLSRLLPQITLSSDDNTPLTFGVSWKELQKNPDDILNLSEQIAKKKKIKIVVCIDEFQNIASFDSKNILQKKMRSHFQKHKHVSYCFYGSKRHMLLDVFTNPSMPFYKFGDIIFLQKIATKEWVNFIQRKFKETGKKINVSSAKQITLLVENHSYYVQQLAQQVWLRTHDVATLELVKETHQTLTEQLSLLFVNITENLSTTQLGFLKALLNNETKLSSQSVLKKYKLGTSANVVRLKASLQQKEIIDIVGKTITFQDPIYKHWLCKEYFKIN